PGACAAHTHAGGGDPRRIDLRARFQVVDQALFVAEHHAPKSTALPEVELEQAGLLALRVLQPPRWALTDALPVKLGIDRCHDVALLGERGADELTTLGIGSDAFLGAAVAVQSDDRGSWPLTVLRDEKDAGDDVVHAIVKLEPLQDVTAVIFFRDDPD